ncbi:EKC/KEOPS complex subunit PCC1/LAGE3 [Paragonimus westermani]|uniref:EKC/KEOPS complex subunit PCC1/LAGE3 n=1 Tax=Paragonimus westermani TaxID=34504 RepID=A0A5J4NWP7_9TREM|nr:EKC/KEOPS complex subunit PCC1/LAGE3 [Paragonimus westermani]
MAHSPTAYQLGVHLQFPDERSATIALRTLSVDAPPPRSSVTQTFHQDGKSLICQCVAPLSGDSKCDPSLQLGKLRIAAHAVVDLACLVLETVEAFRSSSLNGSTN